MTDVPIALSFAILQSPDGVLLPPLDSGGNTSPMVTMSDSSDNTVDWKSLLDRLTDELITEGKLWSPHWVTAFRSVPRHLFVPEYYHQDASGRWQRVLVNTAEAIDTAYRNIALFTDVDERGHGVSSTSMPGLMTRMLELIDPQPGQKVLEIGTGTGYNTALLCAALGAENVASLDIDYLDTARHRLASLGFSPKLCLRDGILGWSRHAPYGRILSTVAVPFIPANWLDQLNPGGKILADLKINASAGNLILLHKWDDTAEGRFDSGQAWLMRMRHPGRSATTPAERADTPEDTSSTALDAVAWHEPVPWFLSCLELNSLRIDIGYLLYDDGSGPRATTLTTSDGSWAEVGIEADTSGKRQVTQAGPTRIWDSVERGYALWEAENRPGWERLGMTVAPGRQWVWLDHPQCTHQWDLPSAVANAGTARTE